MKRKAVAAPTLVTLIVMASLSCARHLSLEEERQLRGLQGDLGTVSQQLAAATAEDARYSGGLIKSLIAVRLEVLGTTKALIEQRIQALQAGSPITVVTMVANPDQGRALQLLQEIDRESGALRGAQAEAARYYGGLVAALAATTVATEERTLATLRQQYLIAKYGLVAPVGYKVQEAVSAPTAPEKRAAALGSTMVAPNLNLPPRPGSAPLETREQRITQAELQVIEMGARITERNDTWCRYAWKLTLRNPNDQPARFSATIEFRDKDNFVVDSADEYGLVLGVGEQKTFTGFSLINVASADKVDHVTAKLKPK